MFFIEFENNREFKCYVILLHYVRHPLITTYGFLLATGIIYNRFLVNFLMTEKNTALENRPQFDYHLDAKGLNCPLPILKTKVMLNKMQAGEVIYVESTDPHSRIDFEAYCARSRNELIRVIEENQVYHFYVCKVDENILDK